MKGLMCDVAITKSICGCLGLVIQVHLANAPELCCACFAVYGLGTSVIVTFCFFVGLQAWQNSWVMPRYF